MRRRCLLSHHIHNDFGHQIGYRKWDEQTEQLYQAHVECESSEYKNSRSIYLTLTNVS
jgi:hypothetical protein